MRRPKNGRLLLPVWILLTFGAAFLQNARSALQKDLKTALGPEGGGVGATFARFGFALPFAALFFAIAFAVEPPAARGAPTPEWALLAFLGAMAQLVATWALLESFDHANFAIGTAFSKFEAVFAALLGVLFAVYAPSLSAAIGIVASVAGAAILTVDPAAAAAASASGEGGPAKRRRALAVQWGLVAGLFFAGAAVGFRHASLALDGGSVAYRAMATLLLAVLLQCATLGLWLRMKRPAVWRATLAAWRPGLRIGAAGAGASACWFAAMTLEPAAHVKALGQVELVFAVVTAWAFFGEPPKRREILGVAMIGGGAALLLAGIS